MDPYTELAILGWIAGGLLALFVAWRVRAWRRNRHVTRDRETRSTSRSTPEYVPMEPRDMRAADMERVIRGAFDDIIRPRDR